MENIGGQAVIEGVMIKSKKWTVTAVRKSNGKIIFRKKRNNSLTKKKFWGLPLIRGVIVLGETLADGYRALDYSAREASDEGEGEKLSTFHVVLSLVLAIVLALVIFKLIPLAVVQFLNKTVSVFKSRAVFNLTEGLLKIALLVGYIYAISLMKDIRRVFQYHGAEHKAVNCYEKEKTLKPERAKKYSTLHPRCGTSFLLLVLVVSIIAYTLLPMGISFWWKYFWRILLLPVIGGASYEVIKLSSTYRKSVFFRALAWPGMFLQRITTREPDIEQLKVALFAVKKAAL